jgi:hypothetical protein
MPSRRFVDAHGAHWEVLELHAERRHMERRTDEATPRPTLYFISRFDTRRSEEFPGEWYRMSSAQLTRLCADARPLAARSSRMVKGSDLERELPLTSEPAAR